MVEPFRISVGVLEDQLVLRESLADLLLESGFEVPVCCGELEELKVALSARQPNLLLVDLRLSSWDQEGHETGWAAIDWVRATHPSVRVVVLTGCRQTENVERAQRSGAAGFLPKETIGSSTLVTSVQRIARGEQLFPAINELVAPAPQKALPRSPLAAAQLTQRELEVLALIGQGLANAAIGERLGITERTVREHVSRLYRKLGSENRTQLALLAREYEGTTAWPRH